MTDNRRKEKMRRIVLAAMMVLSVAAFSDAHAQSRQSQQRQQRQQPPMEDINSANYVMPGCRELIAMGTRFVFQQGLCAGITRAALGVGSCPPETGTYGQAHRIIVRYIDDRPARQHEDFVLLAREALQQAWPCRR